MSGNVGWAFSKFSAEGYKGPRASWGPSVSYRDLFSPVSLPNPDFVDLPDPFGGDLNGHLICFQDRGHY